MKKIVRSICIGVLLCVLCSIPTFAFGVDQSLLLLNGVNEQTVVKPQPRGSVISTGTLRISNEGEGAIGVFMQTLAHIDVDETTFGLFLDRWIASEKRWANVEHYTFTFTKEDYPDEDLAMKSLSFKIIGQPVDCYYRLRGMHLVVAGGEREMLTTQTDGVLLTQ